MCCWGHLIGQGLAAVGGSGPGSQSHCKPSLPQSLASLPAEWTSKALFLLDLPWNNQGVNIRTCMVWVKRCSHPGYKWWTAWEAQRRGWRWPLSGWLSPVLDSEPEQPRLDSLVFKEADSSLSFSVHIFYYVLLFGMNKTLPSLLCFLSLFLFWGVVVVVRFFSCMLWVKLIDFWANWRVFSFFCMPSFIVCGWKFEIIQIF